MAILVVFVTCISRIYMYAMCNVHGSTTKDTCTMYMYVAASVHVNATIIIGSHKPTSCVGMCYSII